MIRFSGFVWLIDPIDPIYSPLLIQRVTESILLMRPVAEMGLTHAGGPATVVAPTCGAGFLHAGIGVELDPEKNTLTVRS